MIVLLIVAVYSIWNSYPCILLKFTKYPITMKTYLNENKFDFIFLNGINLCAVCNSGEFISKLKDKEKQIFIVTEDFSDIDINNFRNTFKLKAIILRRDQELIKYVKKITSCSKINAKDQNLYLSFKHDGQIDKIMTF